MRAFAIATEKTHPIPRILGKRIFDTVDIRRSGGWLLSCLSSELGSSRRNEDFSTHTQTYNPAFGRGFLFVAPGLVWRCPW
jgi:hypothetical protein